MSRSAFLDPDDSTPQVLFSRHHGPELEAYVVRFRTLDLALDAVMHNERVPQFATMGDVECPPFVCYAGNIKTAQRLIYGKPSHGAYPGIKLVKAPEFAPCTCGIIRGECTCASLKSSPSYPEH